MSHELSIPKIAITYIIFIHASVPMHWPALADRM